MAYLDDDVLHIYVDGSSLSKPRRGGVGVRFVWTDDSGDELSENYPIGYAYEGGRIGQMELKACAEALKTLVGRHSPVSPHLFRKVILHTDSRYVAENYPNAKWGGWREKGWRTKDLWRSRRIMSGACSATMRTTFVDSVSPTIFE